MDRPKLPIPGPVPPPQEVEWQPGQARSIVFDRVRLDIGANSFAEAVTLRLRVPDDPPPIPEHLQMPYVFQVGATSKAG